MQAVILAGGRGERLRPLTADRPKPLVPLFGRPLLGYLVEHLRNRGVEEILVSAGHLGEQVAQYVTALPSGIPVHCRIERQARGTAGAVADLLPQLHSPFLVVSGDAVIDIDVGALADLHRRASNTVTLCLAPPAERLRFGTVALRGGSVSRFLEKPALAELLPETSVSTGCYLLEREALVGLPPDQPADFALDVFPALLRRGARLGALAAARFWRDIGTLEAYRDAHFDGLGGSLPWRLPPAAELRTDAPGGPVHLGQGVQLSPGSRLFGPAFIGDGCRIERGAEVRRCVLLAGSSVGPGAVVADCVLERGARVPAGWQLVGAGVAGHPAAALRQRRPAMARRPAAALSGREAGTVAAAPLP